MLKRPETVGEEVPKDNQRGGDKLGGKNRDTFGLWGSPKWFQQVKLMLQWRGEQPDDQQIQPIADQIDQNKLAELRVKGFCLRCFKGPSPVPVVAVDDGDQKGNGSGDVAVAVEQTQHKVQHDQINDRAACADYGELNKLPEALLLSKRRCYLRSDHSTCFS